MIFHIAYLTAKGYIKSRQRDLNEAARQKDLEVVAKHTEPVEPGIDQDDSPSVGSGEKSSKKRRLDEPDCHKLFNEEGKAVSTHPVKELVIGNLHDVLHSKQENWNKIGDRLQFRLFLLVKDGNTNKLHDDFYYEENENDSYVVQEARKVKITWSHSGMVLKAVSIFKQFYLQIYPHECVMLEGFTCWAEGCTRLFMLEGTASFTEECIAYFFESLRKGRDIEPWCVDAPGTTTILINMQNNPACKRQQIAPRPRGRGHNFRGRGHGHGRGRYDGKHQEQRPVNKSEICHNFNGNRCNYASCSRRHVCSLCKSTLHKQPDCPTKTQ